MYVKMVVTVRECEDGRQCVCPTRAVVLVSVFRRLSVSVCPFVYFYLDWVTQLGDQLIFIIIIIHYFVCW